MEQRCSVEIQKVFLLPCLVWKADLYISDLFLICVKTFEDLVLEFDIPISYRRKYNSWRMVFIWIGFRTQRTFKKISLIKSVLRLWVKRKSQRMFILYWETRLLLRLKQMDCIVWMLWMRWNRMIFIMPTSSAPLKPSWGLFTLNLFIRQSALTNFSIELVELILPIVTFVIIPQKLFYTYFVNVKKFPPPFGMNYVFWLIMFLGNPLLSQILKKLCGVTDLSEHNSCIYFLFLCLKFYLHRCKFQQPIPILSHF